VGFLQVLRYLSTGNLFQVWSNKYIFNVIGQWKLTTLMRNELNNIDHNNLTIDAGLPGLTAVHPGGSGGGSKGGISFFFDVIGVLNDAVSRG
jgi:hypothetical protein